MIDISTKLEITVLNSFELTSKKENFEKAFIDGIHFCPHGSELIFKLIKDEILKRVEKIYKEVADNK